ncbi:hypothetical protein C1646_751281 [Rhizophagus diaphanus]|nr:hypothetical protein C1646_751281 [Rhizophagus diaphanus] [Rhizophagus sp. MUCL 43196]
MGSSQSTEIKNLSKRIDRMDKRILEIENEKSKFEGKVIQLEEDNVQLEKDNILLRNENIELRNENIQLKAWIDEMENNNIPLVNEDTKISGVYKELLFKFYNVSDDAYVIDDFFRIIRIIFQESVTECLVPKSVTILMR